MDVSKNFRLLSPLGLSIFFLFTFAGTSIIPASAHTISSRPNTIAHTVATKSSSSVTPHLGINTNVVCTPQLVNGTLSLWTNTKNGPASYGCGGNAWQIKTPTANDPQDFAVAEYDMGSVFLSATYSLRAFITTPANATVDYSINYDEGAPSINDCVFTQAKSKTVVAGWNTVCTFSVDIGYIGDEVYVEVSSGQAHPGIMSASAIQLLAH